MQHRTTSTPTTERRARPRGPGCSACASTGTPGHACPAPQASEAADPLDFAVATVAQQVGGLLLIALAAAVCAMLITFIGGPP